jgi:hypothetical protein
MKRIAFLVLGLAVGGLSFQPSAQAQFSSSKNPYCMRGGYFGPGSWDCSYYTFQQCLDSASGLNGTCEANPNFRGYAKSKQPAKRSKQPSKRSKQQRQQ